LSVSLEALQAAGLYDPDAANAHERREYLEYLLERYSVEQILSIPIGDDAHPVTDILTILRSGSVAHLTALEVAERTGMTPEAIEQLRAIVGLPLRSLDSPEIAEFFVDDVVAFQFAASTYGEERAFAFWRVLGAVTAAVVDAGRELSWGGRRDVPMTELEVAKANHGDTTAAHYLPEIFRHLFSERATRDIWIEEDLRHGSVTMAIGFVDLVGSTQWTAALTSEDHAAALNRFEDLAVRAASRHGARVVKFLGDAAMVVGREADAVTGAAAELCAAVGIDDVLPAARGAVGYGRVTMRGGDYFGDVVNVVARATKEASGDALVATVDAAAALDPSRWKLGEPRPVSLRGTDVPVELVDVYSTSR
jgi:class 3 adenylate cyclase